MRNGYVKIYRKMLDNPVVCKDSDYLAVWIYLLLSAAHEGYQVIFKGEKITLKPGQLITGRKSISQKLKIDESKIQRILSLYENEQQIDQRTTNQNRLISILRWDEYQNNEQQNEIQMNNQRTTSGQPVNTNKNVEKGKNEKENIYNSLPPELHEPIKKFIEHRKKIKKTMSDHATELMLKKLVELSGGDIETSIQILEQSILNGWAGVFPLKEVKSSEDPYAKLIREAMQDDQSRNNNNAQGHKYQLPEANV